MILVTTENIPGYKIVRICGLAKGCSVRGVHFGDDMVARMKNSVGGEVHEYTKLFAQTLEQALDRLVSDARRMGAGAIIGLRFTSTEIAAGVAELMAYGTAVIVESETQ
jgi:uncharacterized protein YbjQ (UPF0145 family)